MKKSFLLFSFLLAGVTSISVLASDNTSTTSIITASGTCHYEITVTTDNRYVVHRQNGWYSDAEIDEIVTNLSRQYNEYDVMAEVIECR